jgi:hypothetical protein
MHAPGGWIQARTARRTDRSFCLGPSFGAALFLFARFFVLRPGEREMSYEHRAVEFYDEDLPSRRSWTG